MHYLSKLCLIYLLVVSLAGCSGSDEPQDTTAPAITLNGEASLEIVKGATYLEQGAIVTDDVSADLTIDISGTVDTSTADTYLVTYTSTDEAGNTTSITRTVTVTEPPDTEAPEIILIGGATITLILGDDYSELGAEVTDNMDDDVELTITGEVDTSVIGSYILDYTARDDAGNEYTVSRTVTVKAAQLEGDAYIFHSSNDDSYLVEYWGDTWGTGTIYTDNPTDTTYAKELEILKSSEWGTVVAWGNEPENAINISQYTITLVKEKH